MIRRLAVAVFAISLMAATASAGTMFDPQAAGFSPRVPVSPLGVLGSWFDPSRVHVSSSLSVGTGWGSSGTNALQVTSLAYQFKAPIALNVSVGNAFGPGAAGHSSFFLEGMDLTWKPSANSVLQIQYHDFRSPLQYGYGPYGYMGPGRSYYGW